MQNVKSVGQSLTVGQSKLHLDDTLLQITERALYHDLAPVHYTDVIAHVLKLAQIVRRDKHCRSIFRNVGHHNTPYLAAHHGVKTVNRLVEHEYIGPQRHHHPKRGLLLHALGQLAHLPLCVKPEHLAKLVEALVIKLGVNAAVKAGHFAYARVREKENIIGNIGNAVFHRRVFKHRLAVNKDISRILPVDSGKMADDRALAGSVRADKPVNRSVGNRHIKPVERAEAVKLLDDVSYLNHFSALLSGAAKASAL